MTAREFMASDNEASSASLSLSSRSFIMAPRGRKQAVNIFPIQPAPPQTPIQPLVRFAAPPSPGEEFADVSPGSSDEKVQLGLGNVPIITSPIK
ncbi:hypothetical protein CVT25_008681 [Psilocybe cyanescens]|uniref:Uncharacterized protein n=1 Tax=Psilocybe cyanescens TaxID=93625 RepID=A0A409XRN1_PSICY|nr:hypothetical protein CVT25_008681 [Psilocybe cyanescens]